MRRRKRKRHEDRTSMAFTKPLGGKTLQDMGRVVATS